MSFHCETAQFDSERLNPSIFQSILREPIRSEIPQILLAEAPTEILKYSGILRQYLKAIGSEVEVKLKGGRKLLGTLLSADEESIALKYSALEAVEGKKKKVRVEHEETFPLSEVNAVLPHISFK